MSESIDFDNQVIEPQIIESDESMMMEWIDYEIEVAREERREQMAKKKEEEFVIKKVE
jgi:hypothetical protein